MVRQNGGGARRVAATVAATVTTATDADDGSLLRDGCPSYSYRLWCSVPSRITKPR
jgi:hypothetical protein